MTGQSRIAVFLAAFFFAVASPILAFAIPAAPHNAEGLAATFSDGKQTVTTVTPSPNFMLMADESIHPELGPAFKAEWTGLLRISKTAKYVIMSEGDSGAKIVLDSKPCVGQPIELEAADHVISITVERKAGPARLQLMWQADFFIREPLPTSVLFHGEDATVDGTAAQQQVIDRGQLLVEELNCIACHRSASKRLVGRVAPDLSHVGTRVKTAWVYTWLADPSHFRAGAAMPAVRLKDEDRRDIAGYLATLTDVKSKLREPQPQSQKVETGKVLYESIGCTSCHAGASKLEGLGSKYTIANLQAYLENPTAVDPSGRMPGMLLERQEANALAQYLVTSHNKDFDAPFPKGADVKRGQALLQSEGCLNCHHAELEGGNLLPSTAVLPVTLEAADLTKGCLADAPVGKAMNYRLNAAQRTELTAFIQSAKTYPRISIAPTHDFALSVEKFRCTACHELNDSKPAEETDRIPPLTGAGSRLRKGWIQTVMTQKQRSRPWYRKRMPEFGGQNISTVTNEIISVSGAGDADTLPVATREQALAGAKLAGSGAGGMGCIVCHGFSGSVPTVGNDTRGPDLSTAAGRLRADHFRRWVLDPKRVHPATPMPAFFAEMPHDQAMEQIETLWQYVALGSNMPPPVGWVDKNNYAVFVGNEPVIVRAHLPGAKGGPNIPRGIAVGLPGGVNYAFDADKCQLAYAWTGGFLDMKPSWSGRGGQVVQVLGSRFFESTTFPFSSGADKHEPSRKFQGYSVKAGIPTFSYTVDGTVVQQTVRIAEKTGKLQSTFAVDQASTELHPTTGVEGGDSSGGTHIFSQSIQLKEPK